MASLGVYGSLQRAMMCTFSTSCTEMVRINFRYVEITQEPWHELLCYYHWSSVVPISTVVLLLLHNHFNFFTGKCLSYRNWNCLDLYDAWVGRVSGDALGPSLNGADEPFGHPEWTANAIPQGICKVVGIFFFSFFSITLLCLTCPVKLCVVHQAYGKQDRISMGWGIGSKAAPSCLN